MATNCQFQDFGALWEHPNGDDFQGKIYGLSIVIRENPHSTPADRFPDWKIYEPDATKECGALWAKTSAKGVDWISGSITIEGHKRNVGLWPAKRNKDTSPHWRVMPPRDEAPPPPPPVEETPPDLGGCSCGSDQCDGTDCDGIPF